MASSVVGCLSNYSSKTPTRSHENKVQKRARWQRAMWASPLLWKMPIVGSLGIGYSERVDLAFLPIATRRVHLVKSFFDHVIRTPHLSQNGLKNMLIKVGLSTKSHVPKPSTRSCLGRATVEHTRKRRVRGRGGPPRRTSVLSLKSPIPV